MQSSTLSYLPVRFEGTKEKRRTINPNLVYVTSILHLHSFFFYSPGRRFVLQTEIWGNIIDFFTFVFFLYLFHYSSCRTDQFTLLILKLLNPGGGSTPYDGLYGNAPPERGTFFRLQVYERVGKLVVWVCKVTY